MAKLLNWSALDINPISYIFLYGYDGQVRHVTAFEGGGAYRNQGKPKTYSDTYTQVQHHQRRTL